MPALDAQFPEMIQYWGNLILVWVGYGTLTGLLAKAIMPGPDPGGAVATLCMGIGGAVIGCGILAFFYDGARIAPISPVGFLVATGGAFVLLFFYRLLGGYFFVEGDEGVRRQHLRGGGRRRRRSRRRYSDALLD
jgi:uncharacterized membrane protein YeaQ/YmgE (transglycosylase-associated protein family)